MPCLCWTRKKPRPEALIYQDDSKPVDKEPIDLWDRAYKALKSGKDSSKLIESYEKIIEAHLKTSTTVDLAVIGSPERQKQMSLLVMRKLEEMDAAQWKFHVGDKEVVIREQLNRIVKGVLFAKDFISQGVSLSADPHAGLAWAGVCMLLPLLLNPVDQYDSLTKGLDQISDIICRFTVIERLYRQPEAKKISADMAASFEVNMVKLYSRVLKYQAQVVCRSPLALVQIGRDMLKLDEWDKLLGDILAAEKGCLSQTAVIDSEMLHKAFENMNNHQDKLLEAFESQQKNLENIQQKQDQTLEEVKAVRSEQKEWHASGEASKCLESLYAWTPETGLDYESDKDLNPKPIPGTCKWFLEDSRYETWLKAKESSILWVTASPGCGKSVLSKLLVDQFQSAYAKQSQAICYFFFKDISDKRRSVICALRALLHQLFTNNISLLRHAIDDFKNKGPSFAKDFGTLWKIFMKAATDPDCGEIICVMDALDESEQSQQGGFNGQALLIGKLTELFSGSENSDTADMKLKFIVTSRPYFTIERMFHELTRKVPTIRFDGDEETKKISADIDLVIDEKIKSLYWLKDNVKIALVNRLKNAQNRTYLWVYLIFPAIEASTETTEVDLLKTISNLPHTLEETYEGILKRSPNREKARRLLQIVIAANRPLTIAEMNVAMAISNGAKSEKDLMSRLEEQDDFRQKIINICGLFVRVIGQSIYLVHQSAKDFLETPSGSSTQVISGSETWEHSLEPRESNLIIAKICISYLQFALDSHPLLTHDSKDYWEASKEINQYLRDHQFLDYASKNWVSHFRSANSEPTLLQSVLAICDTRSQRFQTWFQVYWTTQHSLRPRNLTDIMVGSYFGLEIMVENLLMRGVEFDARDNGGRTPLSWAAGSGNVNVVQLLLNQDGLELNSKDDTGRTPVSWASEAGEEAVVRLLLQHGANIQIKDEKARSALHWAVEYGRETTIRLLLEHADKMAAGDDHKPPLLYSTNDVGFESLVPEILDSGIDSTLFQAVGSGDSGLVRLLADAGANIEIRDFADRTPLLAAITDSREEVTRLLLKIGANIKVKGDDGVTVLHIAAEDERNQRLILLLLENGVDVNIKDDYGQTALHRAARHGIETTARTLVGIKEININARDNYGQTPLHLAAAIGHDQIVQLLLKQDDIDSECKDLGGNTALLAAIGGNSASKAKDSIEFQHFTNDCEREAAVRSLLQCNNVDPNATDNCGKSALIMAVASSNSNMARLLLERDDVKRDTTDNEGKTALIYAAQYGHEEAVRLLVGKCVKDVEGEMAIREAAWNGNEEVVRLLLDSIYESSNTDEKSKSGHWLATAQLGAAIRSGDDVAVQRLLENGAEVPGVSRSGETALMLAVDQEHEKIVRLLLDNGVDVNSGGGGCDYPPLHRAAVTGNLEIVRLLVDNGADINAEFQNMTALSFAADRGHEDVVRLLLDRQARTECRGWTALKWAAWKGHTEIVQILVENGADIDVKSLPIKGEESPHDETTPLCLAAEANNFEIVQLLAKSRADVTATSPDGSTALHFTAKQGQNALIQLLVENGAKIDAQNSQGRTALQNAIEHGHEATTRLLLELGAQPIDLAGIEKDSWARREDFRAAVEVVMKWP